MSARNDLLVGVVAASALALAGCSRPPIVSRPPMAGTVDVLWGTRVTRYVDRFARVVCWVSDDKGGGGGIACLPCADVAAGVCDEATP